MAERVRVWFDPEGDFLEVLFSDAPGYMRETDNEAVMERVDDSGRVIGFSGQPPVPRQASDSRIASGS